MITRNVGRTVAVLTTSLTLVAAPVVFAGSALAAEPTATVGAPSGDIVFHGGNGANNLTVDTIPDPDTAFLYQVVFRDRVDIRPGFNCKYPVKTNHKVVWCSAVGDFSETTGLTVYLDGGNDRATIAAHSRFGGPVHGGSGNDTIVGSDSLTTAYGDGGNDTITGSSRGDRLYGGPGNDRILGGRGNDTIYGNSGRDTIYGNSGNDTISGGPGTDKISGGPGKNRIKQ